MNRRARATPSWNPRATPRSPTTTMLYGKSVREFPSRPISPFPARPNMRCGARGYLIFPRRSGTSDTRYSISRMYTHPRDPPPPSFCSSPFFPLSKIDILILDEHYRNAWIFVNYVNTIIRRYDTRYGNVKSRMRNITDIIFRRLDNVRYRIIRSLFCGLTSEGCIGLKIKKKRRTWWKRRAR